MISSQVLFQPTNFVPVEHEIYLSQAFPWGDANRISFSVQLNLGGIFHENLPPDVN